MQDLRRMRAGLRLAGGLALLIGLLAAVMGAGAAKSSVGFGQTAQAAAQPKPRITWTRPMTSPPLRVIAANRVAPDAEDPADELDLGPMAGADSGYSADGALQSALLPATIPSTQQNFEGISNQDNFSIFGGRVNPPDPVGDVGPNHYVEMVNLTFAVYNKTGTRLLGPLRIGTLWQDFSVPDCADAAGDPVVLYDQLADRWILTQFTAEGILSIGTVLLSRRPAIRLVPTTATRSYPAGLTAGRSSRTTRSTESGRTRLC